VITSFGCDLNLYCKRLLRVICLFVGISAFCMLCLCYYSLFSLNHDYLLFTIHYPLVMASVLQLYLLLGLVWICCCDSYRDRRQRNKRILRIATKRKGTRQLFLFIIKPLLIVIILFFLVVLFKFLLFYW
jgi:hypothetical protein